MAPRFVVIGVDADGRSCVAEVRDVADGLQARLPGVEWNLLWSTSRQPPELQAPRHRGQDADFLDIQLGAGATRWAMFKFEPGWTTPSHHTASLDYDIVLEGEITLGLEAGEVLLRKGDAVMIPGVMHSWSAGPEGCTLSVVYFGLTPPPDS